MEAEIIASLFIAGTTALALFGCESNKERIVFGVINAVVIIGSLAGIAVVSGEAVKGTTVAARHGKVTEHTFQQPSKR